MSWLFVVLGIILSLVFFIFWLGDFRRAFKGSKGLISFLKTARARESAVFVLILALPILFVNSSQLGGIWYGNKTVLWLVSILFAFLVSYFWYRYISWLDLFEKEHAAATLATFIMASMTVFLVWPITGFIQNIFDFHLNDEPWNDWWYCVFVIGLVEEVVKIIPFLIMLKFTKQINEPFDYILYASICALGFAFVENILYLQSTNLTAIHARALYASLAHMFDTSLIAYGMAMARYKWPRFRKWALPVMLIVAAFAHGFYDFWLINPVLRFPLITSLFFIISMHLWVVMKNNLVNLSPFFDPENKIDGRQIRYRIVNGLLAIFYLAYVVQFLMTNTPSANEYLLEAWLWNVYILLFIAVNFGSHEIIKGYVAPVFRFKHAWRFLVPRLYYKPNKTGLTLELHASESPESNELKILTFDIPFKGVLTRRIIYDDDTDCYLIQPDLRSLSDKRNLGTWLIQNTARKTPLESPDPHEILLYEIKPGVSVNNGVILKREARLVGTLIGRAF
jgi:RsiW-degrading membrane proteinase PrsW (M82 family)